MRRSAAALAILGAVLAGAPTLEAAPARRAPASMDQPLLFIADEVQYDDQLGLVTARGHVEISQRDQVLMADMVTYNQKTDTVTASGHVSLLQPTGEVWFGDYMELRDSMQDGFMQNIRALMSDRSRLAANYGRRIQGNITEMDQAVYSPCELCKDDPTHAPLWQIKARRVTHNKDEQTVSYRDAVLEIEGFPILYTPYLSHPDPTVRRQSGFLAPTAGSSSSLGYHLSVPYYWVLDPSSDLTLDPIVTSNAGVAVAGEYRQRFGDGYIRLRGSAADSNRQESNTENSYSPVDTFRGHIFALGEFDPSDSVRTTFDINRSSDQTYLRRFHFGGTESFLQSRVFGERFGDRSYGLIDNYMFQSMREGVGDSTQPIVLPVGTYSWMSHPDAIGGRWNFGGNIENLFRPNGTDIRRVSTGGGWSVPFNGAIGDRFTLNLSLRGDVYNSNDLLLEPGDTNPVTATKGRIYPQGMLDWRYPWVRRSGSYSQFIEPRIALIAAPPGGNPATIPNEDSAAFEFDESDLFVPNRFPGYDRIDTGQRVDYGLNLGFYGDGGGGTRLLVGQSYRFQSNTPFPANSGLQDRLSDIVGRLVVSPARYLDLIYRFRLDHSNLAARQQEAIAQMGPPTLRLNLSYIQSDDPQVPEKQIAGSLVGQLTRYWTVGVFGTRNLGNTGGTSTTGTTNTGNNIQTIESGIGATYRDECLAFSATLSHSGTRDRDVHPGTTLLFTIIFKNIGEFNMPAFSTGSGGTAPVF